MRLRPLIDELKIIDKYGKLVRFGDVMNAAQVDLIADTERQLRDTGQVRTVILKGRQMGLSTAVEAILFVLTFLEERFESLIMSHENDSSQRILRMTRTYWESFAFRRFYSTRYAGQNTMEWTHGSRIAVETAGGRDPGRSLTLRGLHGSEVAFWPDPDLIWSGLRNSIPTLVGALTAIFLESTANGVGNFFHRTWNDAVAGRSEYVPKFYPWWRHPEYTATMLPVHLRNQYMLLGELDAEEKLLVARYKLTPERLAWRRWAIQNVCTGKDARGRAIGVSGVDQFHAEYPCEPNEAFLSTGRNVFRLTRLLAHYRPWTGTRGRLARAANGKVVFNENPEDGELTVFKLPSRDRNWGIYRIGADPSHTTTGDYACAQVIHRRTLEQVAVLRVKCDAVSFGEHLDMLGRFYNTATIAPEKTGPGYATVGALAGLRYPRIWQSTQIATAQGQVSDGLGWVTSEQTKHHAIQTLVRLMRDDVVRVGSDDLGLVVHDLATMTELRDYKLKDDGRGYENGEGSAHDDTVMALAIAYATHMVDVAEIGEYSEPESEGAQVHDLLARRAAGDARVVPAVRVPPRDGMIRHSFEDPITPLPSETVANPADRLLDNEFRDDFGV